MSKLRWVGFILVWSLLLFSATFLVFEIKAEGIATIGYAGRDITPSIGGFPAPTVYLPGTPYNKLADFTQSNLTIRAIVISDGTENIALVSCDCFGLFGADVDRIREKVKDIFPNPGSVIVASTHTHSAPDTTGVYADARINPDMMRYIDMLVDRGAEAIREAYDQKRPARFRVASLRMHDLIRNDRHPEFVDDNLFMFHALPVGKYRETGGVVSDIIQNFSAPFFSEKEQPIFMFNFACHPEFLRKTNMISSDFVGDLRERMELATNNGGVVSRSVFFNGALGGMIVADTQRSDNELSDMLLFSDEFMNRIRLNPFAFQSIDLSPIRFYDSNFSIRLDNKLFQERLSLGLMPQKLVNGNLSVEVSVTEIGRRAVIVAVPGELSPEISLKIRKLFPRRHVAILGLANDELGYILPKERYKETIHQYERSLAVNEKIGDKIFEEIKKLSNKIQGGGP